MKFNDFVELSLFCLRHSESLLSVYGEYEPEVDDFVQYLLDNRDRVELVDQDDYRLYLKVDGNIYGIWVANGLSWYLNSVVVAEPWSSCIKGSYIDGRRVEGCRHESVLWEHKRPSRLMIMRFHKVFGVLKKPKSYVLPPRETKDAEQQ